MIDNTYIYPVDEIAGFQVCPGFYDMNGATVIESGVNFTIHSSNATSCELLVFKREETKPYAVIPFPETYKIGDVYSMIVFGLNIEEFEYAYRMDGPFNPQKGLIFDKNKVLLDPYARAVTGQSIWGHSNNKEYHARVVKDDFRWNNVKNPNIEPEDLIIYELHVRGFTNSKTSNIDEKHKGKFAGVEEKIPYLKKLGINAVELMPIFEFDECSDMREFNGEKLIDYWGYNTVCFFAPNTGYTSEIEYNHEGRELKHLIKELHENGIEVFLDVVFNHTSEGNELGPVFSFKGIDNNVYYMLTPDGKYYNFSGCGNTINANHPIVQQMILECLRYWVIHYHVDGYRFDLASILGRDEKGAPMQDPPLIKAIAYDPILTHTKLIAEAWDAGGLYQVGSFPSFNRWSEWNGKYRDDIRSFLKGDNGYADAAVKRISGSHDMYSRGDRMSINFITCHDGFTLNDLYSYNFKHNLANGWHNTDGNSDNRSWNCGVEGETDNKDILNLRKRMMKNAMTVLILSHGIPMILAGDEFGNSQNGNNNVYCQDNETSWLNWNKLNENKDLFELCQKLIQFRKCHKILSRETKPSSIGFPAVSYHNGEAWRSDFRNDSHFIGVMFAGRREETDDVIYIAVNSFWNPVEFNLPKLPNGLKWKLRLDTMREQSFLSKPEEVEDEHRWISERSIKVYSL